MPPFAWFWILIAAGMQPLLWGAAIFNRLVRLRHQVRTAWSDVDVQLQRRYELVPRLAEVVRGFAGQESEVLERASALRGKALALRERADQASVEAELGAALERVVVLREAYPKLAASDAFGALSEELVQVENQLEYARRFYNGSVRSLNDAVQRVPDRWIAERFGFDAADFFEAHEHASASPSVELS